MAIPNCFYRVSIKAVIRNVDGKILLAKEHDGRRDLPGGWWDHGETIAQTIQREIQEELGVHWEITQHTPLGIRTIVRPPEWWEDEDIHVLIMAYETKISSSFFTPSSECEEVRFFSLSELKDLNLHANAKWLIDEF